jgi:fatty-acyl-CoA synthase
MTVAPDLPDLPAALAPAGWPAHLNRQLALPATHMATLLDRAAARDPEQTAILYFGRRITYRELKTEVDALAAWLQQRAGVRRGDRVLLQMQNCPQFVAAFYAILRADAVVVPANPMLLAEELRYLLDDSETQLVLTSQELLPNWAPLLAAGRRLQMLVACHADKTGDAASEAPDWVRMPRQPLHHPAQVAWAEAIAEGLTPAPAQASLDDLACLPYTSGTTGQPKGCMHTHRSLMFTAVAAVQWADQVPADVALVSLPMFHVTGMQVSMNAAIYSGATQVIMPRWDRELSAQLIARHRVTTWTAISTMMIDFLSSPTLDASALKTLRRVSGGGAAMPAAIAQKLLDLTGLRYMEGYGLSETIATTHANPAHHPKQQCLGIPIFDTVSMVIDPESLRPLPADDVGEIVIHGPQLFDGYWRDEAKTAEACIEIDGKRFLRTGDLGYIDADGYFFFTDRLKRMINASGFKVWPAEVEAMMYRHPEIRECCIVAALDHHRGETVKAYVVRNERSTLDANQLITWAREQMAAYKVPRVVAFVDSLPKSATGKVMWRALQEAEFAAVR